MSITLKHHPPASIPFTTPNPSASASSTPSIGLDSNPTQLDSHDSKSVLPIDQTHLSQDHHPLSQLASSSSSSSSSAPQSTSPSPHHLRPPKRPKIHQPPRSSSPQPSILKSSSLSSLSASSSSSPSAVESPSQSTPVSPAANLPQPLRAGSSNPQPPSALTHHQDTPTIDLTQESSTSAKPDLAQESSTFAKPSSSILHQRIKFGSRQQALALSQAILRRQAEQKDQAPRPASQFHPIKTPLAHLNVPSSAPPTHPSRLHTHYHHHSTRHHPPLWPHSSSPSPPAGQLSHAPISLNNPRPVCIGLLSSLVLILYRLKEFEIDLCGPDGKVRPQTLPVRLCRFPPNGNNEILKVMSPTGEQFGVVEHKIGNVIGPLLGPIHSISGGSAVGGWTPNLSSRLADHVPGTSADSLEKSHSTNNNDDDITETNGLGGSKVTHSPSVSSPNDGRQLYIECCVIRRGEQNPMMLPLQLLLFCPPDSIPSISAYLTRSLVTLEHPLSYHPEMHLGCLYDNPHSSQPREAMETIRHRLLGTSNYPSSNQIMRPSVQICDNQQQVATIFKSLASGVDLDETEPSDLILTALYPHQKQALSFMLDRETLKVVPEDTKSARSMAEKKALEKSDEENLLSLWKKTRDAYGRHVGWVNVVTGIQQIGREPPIQCRGALLADDMGLGKTISIISLIATTLEAAIEYAKSPIAEPVVQADPTHKSLAASERSRVKTVPDNTMQLSAVHPTSSLFEKLHDPRVVSPIVPQPKPKKEGTVAAKKRIAVNDRFHLLKVKSRATLIVCPLSTVQNWESQIEEHVRKKHSSEELSSPKAAVSSLSVCVYHGNSRTSDPHLLADHDVVITTYSLLGYEFSRQNRMNKEAEDDHNSSDLAEEIESEGRSTRVPENTEEKQTMKNRAGHKRKRKCDGLPSPLQAIQWFRVVLDEAHMIKEHTTTQSKAACDLLAERRVCLTGTPLQNSLNDLFSLVCFLRLEPFTDRAVWSTHIGTPARLGEPLGVSRLQLIMRHIALRRTKQTYDKHGKPILTLPPKKDDVVYLELNQDEKEVYSKYHQRSRNTFMTLKKDDTVLKNYCSILQELLRLRQICAHTGLVFDSEAQGREIDLARRIEHEGFSRSKAIQLLILMRDTGATQCSECGRETISASTTENEEDLEDLKVINFTGSRRGGRKKSANPKRTSASNKVSEEVDAKEAPHSSVITKCQHLFCPQCYRERMHVNLRRDGSKEEIVDCSVCWQQLNVNSGVVEVSAAELRQSIRMEDFQSERSENVQLTEDANKTSNKKGRLSKYKTSKAKELEIPSPVIIDNNLESGVDKESDLLETSAIEQQACNTPSTTLKQDPIIPALKHGTKITQLLLDLLPFSQANPASANFAPHDPIFTQKLDPNDPDADYKPIKGAVVKSVVFSQWTKLLDKIAMALDEFKIEYRRLDGTMSRTERNQSMDALKADPKVEVLLVSLRAGGVGLNLTCAQRVYLMEPFWNPAVENQAVDRVHRLGQTKPVRMIRYIISGSVEQNMLEIQKRKTELANMSLGQTLSKAELAKRRVEDLHILFKENLNSD